MVRPRAASLEVPASRYQVSLRPFPESLPAIEYEPGAHVRKVQDKGEISFGGNRQSRPSFPGCPVGIKATLIDGLFDIVFCRQRIGQINLRALG
jgi:hypothetical protein